MCKVKVIAKVEEREHRHKINAIQNYSSAAMRAVRKSY